MPRAAALWHQGGDHRPGQDRDAIDRGQPLHELPFFPATPEAARCFAKAIERGLTCTAIPWQMGIVAKLLWLLPNWLYDPLFRRAPRKARVVARACIGMLLALLLIRWGINKKTGAGWQEGKLLCCSRWGFA